MLMVFGVKSQDDGTEPNSITGKLDARQLKRNAMTQFQVKMQEKLSGMIDHFIPGNKKQQSNENQSILGKQSDMLQSYEDATARIANAIEIRDLKHEKQYMQSCMKSGVGRQQSSTQPLVITRKLGHPELIFNI